MKKHKTAMKKAARRDRRSESGLTLIELLIVIAISAIIIVALLSLYIAGQKYFFNQNSRADTIEESRMPMAWISRDAREANGVFDGNFVAYNGISCQTGVNCLVLELPSIDGAGGLIPGTIDYFIYRIDQGRLQRIIDADGASAREDRTRIMADGVSGFALKYFDENLVELTSSYSNTFIVDVELTTQGRALQRGDQHFQEPVRTQIKLRNKVVS